MSAHQSTGPHAVGSRSAATSAARDPNHALNVRVLRFRHSPHREEPALLAQDLIDVGRHDDALELLEIALAREPGDVDLELLRGRALLGAGDLPRAKETLIRTAKAAPTWAAPLTWLTRALSTGSDDPRAGKIALLARSLGADDTQVVRLAKGQETTERLDARLARFDASPDREEPVMLARELALDGRTDDAHRVLRVALDRDQEDPDALTALAQLERTEGRTDEAIALLRRARSAAPGWDTVERALFSLVGVEVNVDEAVDAKPAMAPERERSVSVLDLDIAIEPLVTAPPPSAEDIDSALDELLRSRRDETVPYAVEARDTEHGAPAIDATLVGLPAPARAAALPQPTRVEAARVRNDGARAETALTETARHELGHGRLRRAGASGWPRRVLPKAEPVAAPYVRVLVGDARPRAARA